MSEGCRIHLAGLLDWEDRDAHRGSGERSPPMVRRYANLWCELTPSLLVGRLSKEPSAAAAAYVRLSTVDEAEVDAALLQTLLTLESGREITLTAPDREAHKAWRDALQRALSEHSVGGQPDATPSPNRLANSSALLSSLQATPELHQSVSSTSTPSLGSASVATSPPQQRSETPSGNGTTPRRHRHRRHRHHHHHSHSHSHNHRRSWLPLQHSSEDVSAPVPVPHAPPLAPPVLEDEIDYPWHPPPIREVVDTVVPWQPSCLRAPRLAPPAEALQDSPNGRSPPPSSWREASEETRAPTDCRRLPVSPDHSALLRLAPAPPQPTQTPNPRERTGSYVPGALSIHTSAPVSPAMPVSAEKAAVTGSAAGSMRPLDREDPLLCLCQPRRFVKQDAAGSRVRAGASVYACLTVDGRHLIVIPADVFVRRLRKAHLLPIDASAEDEAAVAIRSLDSARAFFGSRNCLAMPVANMRGVRVGGIDARAQRLLTGRADVLLCFLSRAHALLLEPQRAVDPVWLCEKWNQLLRRHM